MYRYAFIASKNFARLKINPTLVWSARLGGTLVLTLITKNYCCARIKPWVILRKALSLQMCQDICRYLHISAYLLSYKKVVSYISKDSTLLLTSVKRIVLQKIDSRNWHNSYLSQFTRVFLCLYFYTLFQNLSSIQNCEAAEARFP